MKSLISIIIPTFNSETCIRKSIDSVLNQTFSDFEIIVMDGNSKDNTVSVLESYQDARIKIFSEPDKGVYDAMNKGLVKAEGEWLFFLGSDDSLYNNLVLETVASKLKQTKNHVLYGNVLVHGDTGWANDGQIYNGKFSFQKLLKSNICHQCIFYRKEFVAKHKLSYDLKYPVSADWDFNISCRLHTEFTYINSTIAHFTAGGISTGSLNEPFLKERKIKYAHLYEKYKPSLFQLIGRKFQSLVKTN